MPRFSLVALIKSCLLPSIMLICTAPGYAQAVIPQGITQWSTQIKAGPVLIDMATGNMMMNIPVRSKPGAIPFSFNLIDNMNNQGAPNSLNNFLWSQSGGELTNTSWPTPTLCGPQGQQSHSYAAGLSHAWSVSDGTGASHPFQILQPIILGPNLLGCGGTYGPVTAVALDGSGYTAVVTGSSNPNGTLSFVAYNKDGMSYPGGEFSLGTLTDADGNTISASGLTWTDTLGKTAMSISGGGGNGNPEQFYYTDSNGNNQYFTEAFTSQHVKTLFTCIAPYGDIDTTMYLPSSITTPTGAQYTFTYEATPGYSGDVTGRLAKVTLPSGGYFSFAYANYGSGGINGFNCTSRVIPQLQVTENDNNGHTSTTTYQNSSTADWQQGYSPSNFTVIETDQLGDVTTHYFSSEQETERVISDVNLGVLSTTITCYNGNFTNCPTTGASLNDGVVEITQTDVYTYPGTSSSPSLVETKLDTYGNPTQVSRWDFGAAFPPTGNPASKTAYTYDTATGPCGTLSNAYIVDRPCSVTTTNNGGATVSQTNYTYNSTGHPTQTSQLVSGSTFLNSSASYNSNGTLHNTTDPNNNVTTLNYDGSCNSLLSTGTTLPTVNGVTITTSQTWDCNGGVKTSSTDANGNVTTYSYATGSVADPLWRLTKVSYPDGGSSATTYSTGTSLPWSVSTSTAITTGNNLNNTALYDGLGRVTQTQLNSDPDGVDYVDTTYDLLGRKATVSNPHRSGSLTTDGITTYGYDALDRVLSVLQPDGSRVSTTYNNNCTTVTDETGKARKSCVDGLGRLTGVWEDPSGVNYETDYGYDALNNLLTVIQKGGTMNSSLWRNRTFSYDGLSRLLSAYNPESGNISYGYDGDGNLSSKIAPLPNQIGTSTVTTNYVYDALNRLTKKSYTDGTLQAQFGYDGVAIATGCVTVPPGLTDTYPKGLRTSMCDGSGGTSWGHDKMGRVLSERRSIGGVRGDYDTDIYNLDGSVGSVTSLGYQVGYTYNNAGREITVKNFADPFNYVTSANYAPFGGLTVASLGAKPITITNAYNDRMQPLLISASASASIISLCYDFHLKVAVTSGPCEFSAYTSGDNGNVFQIANERDGNRTQNFMYDSLNRIQQAYTNGTNWGETYGSPASAPGVAPTTPGIDGWGNLTNRSGVTGKTLYEPLSVSAGTNNQLSGFGYDAPGNMTSNGGASYTYDAENRLIATAGISYIYDGDGKRVEKCTEGTLNGNPAPGTCASNATGTMYWTGTGGDPLAETDLSGNVLENYISFNGRRIARRDASTKAVHYYFSDHLGTHSLITDANGTMPAQEESDFYPYGGEIPITTGDTNHYKFTGKERDTESALDSFGKRHYASTLGRWMSADLVNVTDDRTINPANTLNKYAYGGNSPLKYIDPDGRDITVFYDQGGPGGHIILLAYDQQSGNSAVQSFGPVNHDSLTRVKELFSIPVPGKDNYGFDTITSADQLRKQYASLTIQTSPEETQEAIQYIRTHPGGNYVTLGNNCTTTCSVILRKLKRYSYGPLSPNAFFITLADQYSKHPQFQWPNNVPQNGIDYGSPSHGYDAFELLFLSIQHQLHEKVTHRIIYDSGANDN